MSDIHTHTLLVEVDRERIEPGTVTKILDALAGVRVLEHHSENVLAEDREPMSEGTARAIRTIMHLRDTDSDFITVDTIRAYTNCMVAESRAAIVAVFGQAWLDRQDAVGIK